MVAALLQGAEHTHQNGLGLGPILTAVGVAVLPGNHRRADLSFTMIVVERNRPSHRRRRDVNSVLYSSFRRLPKRIEPRINRFCCFENADQSLPALW